MYFLLVAEMSDFYFFFNKNYFLSEWWRKIFILMVNFKCKANEVSCYPEYFQKMTAILIFQHNKVSVTSFWVTDIIVSVITFEILSLYKHYSLSSIPAGEIVFFPLVIFMYYVLISTQWINCNYDYYVWNLAIRETLPLILHLNRADNFHPSRQGYVVILSLV